MRLIKEVFWLAVEIFGNGLILLFGGWSLFFLYQIAKYGKITLVEPNIDILILEIIWAVLIIAFAIERTVKDIRKWWKRMKA